MSTFMDEKLALASEETPLIRAAQHRRRQSVRQHRYPYKTRRGLLSVVLSGLGFVSACFLIILTTRPDLLKRTPRNFHHQDLWGGIRPIAAWPESNGIAYKELEDILHSTPEESRIRDASKYYTSGPHVAGRNMSQAIWTRNRWQEMGIRNSKVVAYDVLLNYPKGHRLALLETEDKSTSVKYEAVLEEDIIPEDPTSTLADRVPTFHGYSASGNVTAQYVWANYGTFADFEELVHANVSLDGKIALVRYGKIFRGLKVKRAQELGMIGCIIYSDPGDDGGITEKNGYKLYPNGPARQPSSVQRGSVQYLSHAPGDPTTIGYPSKQGAPRQDPKDNIPQIPSIPISYLDALPLLQALNGHGPSADDFSKDWHSGGLRYKDVKYNIGPSPPSLTVNLFNDQDYQIEPLWNVIGIINGTISDEVVVIGNHRDAWIAGGAVDPNSGSAAMMEVIRGLGLALKKGWKPLRTIVIGSWDGEEYGLVGSTEWVEEFLPWLAKDAVAYINIDGAASGPDFAASAAPLLDGSIFEATSKILSPNQTTEGQTVGDVWDKQISTMGSGSDFTAFQDFAGVPCINIGFGGPLKNSVYHYHSNYDSFWWMEKYGDPGWHYHAALAKVWGVLTAKLVDSPLIQFNATRYSAALAVYIEAQKKHVKAANVTISFEKIDAALAKLESASIALDAKASKLSSELQNRSNFAWYKHWKKSELFHAVRKVNKKYKYMERQFLYTDGLDGRSWFKHTVFAPGRWTGYAGATFPGLGESLEDNDMENYKKWQDIIAGQMLKAALSLQ